MRHIWMAMDPEDRRILVQSREFIDGDFPPGLRGLRWPRREADVSDEEYELMMRGLVGGMTGREMDELHVRWWDAARGDGDPLWPDLA